MLVALIVSSFVSASRIGGGAQQYVLAAHRIDPVLAPTVMFGRSPALGGKGEVTSPAALRQMLGDIEADASFGELDLVICGYFAQAEQVEIVATLLERVRASGARQPAVIVDPIMGDAPGGLYVRAEVADAIASRLVPQADWITPNAWELSRLSGVEVVDAQTALQARRALGRSALVTSVPVGDSEVGILFSDAQETALFVHRRLEHAPKGAGDLVAASFGAGLAEGLKPLAAAERAARVVAQAVQAADAAGASDLPIVALAERMTTPEADIRVVEL